MRTALGYVDGFIRNRREMIESIKRGERPGRFVAFAIATYVVLTAAYGLAMGSFRWLHPEFYYSDFEIAAPRAQYGVAPPTNAPAPVRGAVHSMDARSTSVIVERALPEGLVGREVRFNMTNPTPAYRIVAVKEVGPFTEMALDGPAMFDASSWKYALLAALKVPALFLVTLVVCLPALYLLNVALGWRLAFVPMVSVLLFAIAGTSVMLAVLVPIVFFFALLTDHYHFMMLMHFAVFAMAGAYGVQTLAMGLGGLRQEGPPAASRRGLLAAWLMLYMFVGCQAAWSMRPWVGSPYLVEFEALRKESSNVYVFLCSLSGSVEKLTDARR